MLREAIPDADRAVAFLSRLGFGNADVVVAVPRAWIDVRTVADLEDVAASFHARRGRRMRVATKYVNLTRRFFAERGVTDYRIVESLGATEGAPAAGGAWPPPFGAEPANGRPPHFGPRPFGAAEPRIGLWDRVRRILNSEPA